VSLANSAGGRIDEVLQLMRMPVFDEYGDVVGYESIITPEQARDLLDGDGEVAKRCFEELSRREVALEADR
jgi:hypothetical protein